MFSRRGYDTGITILDNKNAMVHSSKNILQNPTMFCTEESFMQ